MNMDAEDWLLIRSLFEQTIDLSPDLQERFLVAQTQLAPQILHEVRLLIQLSDQADDFLESGQQSPAIRLLEEVALQSSWRSHAFDSLESDPVDSLSDASRAAKRPAAEIQPSSNSAIGETSALAQSKTSQQPAASTASPPALIRLIFDPEIEILRRQVETQFPNYRLRQVLGQGGQGVVFLAQDLDLQRDVALKVLTQFTGGKSRSGNVGRTKNLPRLLNEARAAAKLQHPHIASVYSVHQSHDLAILVTQFINGMPLHHWIRNQGHVPWQQAAVIAGQVADGLAQAHAIGLVHRDVKPANILLQNNLPPSEAATSFSLDPSRTTRQRDEAQHLEHPSNRSQLPEVDSSDASARQSGHSQSGPNFNDGNANSHHAFLVDFGLATQFPTANEADDSDSHDSDSHDHSAPSSTLASTPDLQREFSAIEGRPNAATAEPEALIAASARRAGSLLYMSPELWNDAPASARSDVYALGVTMYQMLVGRPPFVGAGPQVIRQIMTADPVTPRRIDPSIPRDLESICLKAMSRHPEARYPNAASMASDLRRFLRGQPTIARPLGWPEQFRRWFRRDWKLASGISASALLLFGLTAITTLFLLILQEKNFQLRESQLRSDLKTAEYLVDASPSALASALPLLASPSRNIVDFLQRVAKSPDQSTSRRLNAHLALMAMGQGDAKEIADLSLLQTPSPGLLQTLIRVFPAQAADTAAVIEHWQQRWASLESVPNGDATPTPNNPNEAQVDDETMTTRLNIAWLQFYLSRARQQPSLLSDICRLDADPSDRTAAIFSFDKWYIDLATTQSVVQNVEDPQIVAVILCGLGHMAKQGYSFPESPELWQQWVNQLRVDYWQAPVVISAALWFSQSRAIAWTDESILQAQMGPQTATSFPSFRQVVGDPSDRLVMLRIPAGTTMVGVLNGEQDGTWHRGHAVTLTQDFMISDREITAALFTEFADEMKQQDPDFQWEAVNSVSMLPTHPATEVTWLQAVRFCNWLSRREQRTECYTLEEPWEFEIPERKISIPNWVCDPTADGFRLPSEAEFEYAVRAFSQTDFNFGNRRQWVPSMIAFTLFRQSPCQEVGQFMPNGFGLFDMHGNVWEWTGDWHVALDDQSLVDPVGPAAPDFPAEGWYGKSYRGGGVNTIVGEAISNCRGFLQVEGSYSNLGFRVVCRANEQ